MTMNIKNILMTAVCCFTAMAFTACSDNGDEVKSLTFSRNFTPTDFKLQVTNTSSTTGATVSFGFVWGTPGNPEKYMFEIYEGEEIAEDATPVATLYPAKAGTKDDPYLVSVADNNLLAGTYIARIKAVGNNMTDSYWAVLEKSFKVKEGGSPAPQEQTASLTFAAGDAVAASYSVGCLTININNSGSKISIDGNTAYFGDATKYTKYEARMKTGGKSGSTNGITIVSTGTGKVTIALRTGSSSSVRSVNITKEGEEIASFAADESNVQVEIEGEAQPVKVYKNFEFNVTPGTYEVNYPDGSVNFYGFEVTYTDGEGGGDEPTGATGTEGSVNFGEAAATVTDGQVFTFGSASIKVNNSGSKYAIDLNTAYFGDATTQTKFVSRMKSGAKSSDTNGITLTLEAKGTVTIAMRTGSNSATRAFNILDSTGASVQNWSVGEANITSGVTIEGEAEPKNVYSYYTVTLEAGTYSFSYDGSVNFYGFSYEPAK